MKVLGIACGVSAEYEDNEIATHSGHDAAAALVEGGRVVAAVVEERRSRCKHSTIFPARAAAWCLAEAGLSAGDLDAVAFSFGEGFADDHAARRFLADPTCREPTGRTFAAGLFRRHLGWEVEDRLAFVPHHVAHAWSVFHPSPFEEALVLVLDGVGEDGRGGFASGLVAEGRGDRLEVARTFGLDQSLGLFYQRLIEVAGFGIFEEYKAMALASYGDPTPYAPLLASFYDLLPRGDFRLAPHARQVAALREAGLLGRARRKGAPIEPWHADLVASVQQSLEAIVRHVLEHERARTGLSRLCVAGGVGLNSVANGRILRSGLFDAARFHPASHDAGNALGAALAAARTPRRRRDLGPVAWGPPCPADDAVRSRLAAWSAFLDHAPLADPAEEVAGLLAEGLAVGWVQGRSEFGPRALGRRSILADPRHASTRDRLNRLKGREAFRPLAPAVPIERARDWFEIPEVDANLGHMNVVLPVRPDRRAALAGVTHADGTARLQTVAREDDPLFHALLEAFGRRTGVPVLLNTSFNRAGEPIVDSVDDAVASFLALELDRLVIGRTVARRRPAVDLAQALLPLVPSLAPYKKLVRRASTYEGRPHRHAIESTAARWFDDVRIEVTPAAFEVLLAADGRKALRDLAPAGWPSLAAELAGLWTRRAIVLRPAPGPDRRPG